ncbi:MAG: hypothetical protein HY394_06240 [Candidatus Diapherotrites archaeon]|nr:hypothetical protein [Candidatus Diapherotrites archaeon]
MAKPGKKRISWAQAGALFVIVFMVGSTIAFGVLSSDDSGNGNTPQDGPQPSQQQTTIAYEADNVDASIQQLLPSVRIVGKTQDYDFAKIDKAVYAVAGVKKVQSGYQPNADTNGGYYLADISFSPDYNVGFIAEQLQEKSGLDGLEVYSYAIVEVPKKVGLQNKALNISKEYEFSVQRLTGLVGTSSMPLDKIKMLLSVSLSGEKLVNATAIETENSSAQPVAHSTKASLQVSGLENEIVFSGEYALPSGITEKDLNSALSGIADVNAVSIYLSQPAPLGIEIFADENSLEGIAQDVNALLISDYAVSAEISVDLNAVTVSVGAEEAGLQKIAEGVNKMLSAKYPGAEPETQYPKVLLEGSLSLETGKAETAASQAKSLLEGKGVSVKSLFRLARLSAQTIESEGIVYANDSGFIPALVKPERKENETVGFEVSFYSVRGKAVYANAVEAGQVLTTAGSQ